ncbi:hypothetical protein [uncultured Halomonas sp.]|uniref:hypothetical protein n=1 Tax=uncultured Halomonas sp. TaxID=173971 RepID=UPI00261AE67E|nr:hypothetical protein [uncultured Halomonas sp.]
MTVTSQTETIVVFEVQRTKTQFVPQAFRMPTIHPEALADLLAPHLTITSTADPSKDTPIQRAETVAAIAEALIRSANSKATPIPNLNLPYTSLYYTTNISTSKWLVRQAERRFKAIETVEKAFPNQPVLTMQEYLRLQPSLPETLHTKIDRLINHTPSALLLPVGAEGTPYQIRSWDADTLRTLFGFLRLYHLGYYQTQADYNYAAKAKLSSDPDYRRRFTTWSQPTLTVRKPPNRVVFRLDYLHEYLPYEAHLQRAKDIDLKEETDKDLFITHLLIRNDSTLPLRARHIPREQLKLLRHTSGEDVSTYKQYVLKDYWGATHLLTVSLFLDVQPSQITYDFSTPKATSLKGLSNLLRPEHSFAGDLYYSSTLQTPRRRYNPQYKTPLDRALNNKRW